jgi:type II secretory pathway pseudopilin PulG
MQIYNIKKNKNTQSGFMLVEMIVSVALFSVVMLVSTGSLLSIIDANRKSQAFKIIVNNLNLAVESMSRDIRVGEDFNCGNPTGRDCNLGDSSLYFKSKGKSMVYRTSGGILQKSINGGISFVNVTANDIVIDNLTFYVLGSTPGDTVQSFITLIIKGHTDTKDRMNFGLQTAMSQRKFDI